MINTSSSKSASKTNTSNKNQNSVSRDDLILTIDNGTQSVRALLFDLHGNLVAKNRIELEAYFSANPGWAEQSADYFWQMLGECCQQLWQQSEVINKGYREKVSAVTITTQRGTVINLDKNAKPLRPAILWLDQRLSKPTKVKTFLFTNLKVSKESSSKT